MSHFFSVFYFTLYSVFSRQYPVLLEQSCNLSSSVYIDTLCCRNFRQTWHGHDVTGQGYDEACTSGDFQVTYGNFESGRCAEFGLIIGQAVLGFLPYRSGSCQIREPLTVLPVSVHLRSGQLCFRRRSSERWRSVSLRWSLPDRMHR